jgi:hypothetical protein
MDTGFLACWLFGAPLRPTPDTKNKNIDYKNKNLEGAIYDLKNSV